MTKTEIRAELIHELERSISVRSPGDGSYQVDIGGGIITFTINPHVGAQEKLFNEPHKPLAYVGNGE